MHSLCKNIFSVILFYTVFVTVDCIKCYQCVSTDPLVSPYQCDEFFDNSMLEPQPCNDLHGAQYCIKQVGRFEVSGIKCFQCYSSQDISCTDLLISDGSLHPQPCSYLHDDQYCIKQTGGLGTKRYCSSKDLGNYCNYVRHSGDTREYRSCYFTCTGDGCNTAFSIRSKFTFLISFILLLWAIC